jgi:hypothetical protein
VVIGDLYAGCYPGIISTFLCYSLIGETSKKYPYISIVK